MKKTKKAMEGGVALMVTLVGALLVIGLLLILTGKSGKGIDDAAKEMESFKNLYNPTCDTDKDGIANVKDVCPCDSDASFDSRIYYLKTETNCKISARPALDVGLISDNTINPDKIVYYVDVENSKDPCFQGLIDSYAALSKLKMSREDIEKLCPPLSKEDEENAEKVSGLADFNGEDMNVKYTLFYFYDSCADKILAKSAEFNRPTFTCKTPTKECKKKVTSSDC